MTVELMAPAGSPEALQAAAGNGADAVYLGGKQFNAREGAANFSRDEVLAAVDYAHERGIRVYITVNIILADRELPAALDYLYFLGCARVDGIIVQDLGLAALIRRLLPDLPLIGSTQMTITNAAGARFLQEMGFKRVVLGRELSLADIHAISHQVDIELEAFVHGALCYSYSGQCLLSSMVGGRSGNRGRCAQPCRLAYTLVDGNGQPLEPRPEHLLSTRDLYTLDRVPHLLNAGVRAFKIEGRMRRPEYVAVVTRAYRTIIDRYLADPEGFRVLPQEKEDVAQIFNRDFTPGYLDGDPGAELMSYGRPSNRGLYLGRAGRRRGERFLVRLEAPLRRGDGLEVWVSRGGHQGLVVKHILRDDREVAFAPAGATVALELPPATRPGDRIFKTSDVELLREARDSCITLREERRIPLDMRVEARPGEPLLLEVIDPERHRVRAWTGVAAAVAERHPLDAATLAAQLGRLGNTPYRLGELAVNLEGAVMVPLSELNRVRREALEKLRQERLEEYPARVPPAEEFRREVTRLLYGQQEGGVRRSATVAGDEEQRRQRIPGRWPRLAVAAGNVDGARAALEAGADRVYLGGETWQGHRAPTDRELKELLLAATARGAELVPALPRLWHETEAKAVARQLERLAGIGARLILVAGAGGLQLLKEYGLAGWGDYTFNTFNTWTLRALAASGLEGTTLSPEMNLEQLRQLEPPLLVEVIVHGSLPLMISAHCVPGARLGGKKTGRACTAPCLKGRYGLKDRLGLVFPITTDRQCRLYLYNPRELCLLDHLGVITSLAPDWVRIEAREKEPAYIHRITGLYREGLKSLQQDTGNGGAVLKRLAAQAEALAPAGITRGHYFRGVIE